MTLFRLPKFTVDWSVLFRRRVGIFLVEVAGCAAILDGIAHYSHPAAFIVGGVGAVLAMERQ